MKQVVILLKHVMVDGSDLQHLSWCFKPDLTFSNII